MIIDVPRARQKILKTRNETPYVREIVPIEEREIGEHLFDLIRVDAEQLELERNSMYTSFVCL
jgi:hypothetical protein